MEQMTKSGKILHEIIDPENMKPINYLASPYSLGNDSSQEQRNLRYYQVTRQAWQLFASGINVYSPITHWHNIIKVFPIEMTPSQWLMVDFPYLKASEKLYVLMLEHWNKSVGVLNEINFAKFNNIEIEYIEPTPYVLYGEDIVT